MTRDWVQLWLTVILDKIHDVSELYPSIHPSTQEIFLITYYSLGTLLTAGGKVVKKPEQFLALLELTIQQKKENLNKCVHHGK